jgi:hypothetical protein
MSVTTSVALLVLTGLVSAAPVDLQAASVLTISWVNANTLTIGGRGFPSECEYTRFPSRLESSLPADVWASAQNSSGLLHVKPSRSLDLTSR